MFHLPQTPTSTESPMKNSAQDRGPQKRQQPSTIQHLCLHLAATRRFQSRLGLILYASTHSYSAVPPHQRSLHLPKLLDEQHILLLIYDIQNISRTPEGRISTLAEQKVFTDPPKAQMGRNETLSPEHAVGCGFIWEYYNYKSQQFSINPRIF